MESGIGKGRREMNTPYTVAFACLTCRTAFKREINIAQTFPLELKCPKCSGTSHNFGRHFKAPKKTDIKQWEKIEFLFQHGFRFQKIRLGTNHYDTVPYPETIAQAKEFVLKYRKYAMPSERKNTDT